MIEALHNQSSSLQATPLFSALLDETLSISKVSEIITLTLLASSFLALYSPSTTDALDGRIVALSIRGLRSSLWLFQILYVYFYRMDTRQRLQGKGPSEGERPFDIKLPWYRDRKALMEAQGISPGKAYYTNKCSAKSKRSAKSKCGAKSKRTSAKSKENNSKPDKSTFYVGRISPIDQNPWQDARAGFHHSPHHFAIYNLNVLIRQLGSFILGLVSLFYLNSSRKLPSYAKFLYLLSLFCSNVALWLPLYHISEVGEAKHAKLTTYLSLAIERDLRTYLFRCLLHRLHISTLRKKVKSAYSNLAAKSTAYPARESSTKSAVASTIDSTMKRITESASESTAGSSEESTTNSIVGPPISCLCRDMDVLAHDFEIRCDLETHQILQTIVRAHVKKLPAADKTKKSDHAATKYRSPVRYLDFVCVVASFLAYALVWAAWNAEESRYPLDLLRVSTTDSKDAALILFLNIVRVLTDAALELIIRLPAAWWIKLPLLGTIGPRLCIHWVTNIEQDGPPLVKKLPGWLVASGRIRHVAQDGVLLDLADIDLRDIKQIKSARDELSTTDLQNADESRSYDRSQLQPPNAMKAHKDLLTILKDHQGVLVHTHAFYRFSDEKLYISDFTIVSHVTSTVRETSDIKSWFIIDSQPTLTLKPKRQTALLPVEQSKKSLSVIKENIPASGIALGKSIRSVLEKTHELETKPARQEDWHIYKLTGRPRVKYCVDKEPAFAAASAAMTEEVITFLQLDISWLGQYPSIQYRSEAAPASLYKVEIEDRGRTPKTDVSILYRILGAPKGQTISSETEFVRRAFANYCKTMTEERRPD